MEGATKQTSPVATFASGTPCLHEAHKACQVSNRSVYPPFIKRFSQLPFLAFLPVDRGASSLPANPQGPHIYKGYRKIKQEKKCKGQQMNKDKE